MKNIIYGLADSRNDLIYYIGKTSVGKNRALSHLKNSHSPDVNRWIKGLGEDWGDVKVILVEEVEDLNLLAEREKYWIGFYKSVNPEFLNKKDFPVLVDTYTELDDDKFSSLKNSIFFAGDIIKRRRLALNVSQTELAKASSVSRSTVSLLENNENLTSIKKILLGLTKLEMGKKLVSSIVKERGG